MKTPVSTVENNTHDWSCLLNSHLYSHCETSNSMLNSWILLFLSHFLFLTLSTMIWKLTLSIIGLVVCSTPLVRLTSTIILWWQRRRWWWRREMRAGRLLLRMIREVSLCRTERRSSWLWGVGWITATAVACATRRRHVAVAGVLRRVLDWNRHEVRAAM